MKKILIIDDEKPTLSMFKLFLNAYGYYVFTAENGLSGIDIYKKESPDIVFTDVKMPGMDGIEVLSKIKKINVRSEVIVITGHGDIDLAIQSLDYGATDYINKPINRKSLDSALNRAISRLSIKSPEPCGLSVEKHDQKYKMHLTGSVNCSLLSDHLPNINSYRNSFIEICINNKFSINSNGIKGLIELINELKDRKNYIEINGIPENFIPIFEMTGILKVLK